MEAKSTRIHALLFPFEETLEKTKKKINYSVRKQVNIYLEPELRKDQLFGAMWELAEMAKIFTTVIVLIIPVHAFVRMH